MVERVKVYFRVWRTRKECAKALAPGFRRDDGVRKDGGIWLDRDAHG